MSETPLARKLRLLIEANGPMSIADYMTHCLGDPDYGYYATRDPFGVAGDFITAPEVSQMFGEIVGAWLVDAWRRSGTPAPVRLVELGPGRGTLMADMLRVVAKAPDLGAAMSIHLVETSPELAGRQKDTLEEWSAETTWHASLADVPAGPLLLVANEFFDALPIRQFVRLDTWRERVVTLDTRGRLCFGIGPGVLETALRAAPGSVLELRPAADAIAADIAGRIAADGGAALLIDYGYAETGPGETLQAVQKHAYSGVLESPGEADLTAHVDFAALGRSARAEGAAVHGPMAQGAFLTALGLRERAGALGAGGDKATQDALTAAVERLAGANQMGELFKVLAITRRGIVPPPFDA